jgi:hypothetical protein
MKRVGVVFFSRAVRERYERLCNLMTMNETLLDRADVVVLRLRTLINAFVCSLRRVDIDRRSFRHCAHSTERPGYGGSGTLPSVVSASPRSCPKTCSAQLWPDLVY